MNKLLDFAIDFIRAFAVMAAMMVFAFGIGFFPIYLMIRLGMGPLPYGVLILILWGCAVAAAGFATMQHLSRQAAKEPAR